MLGANSLPLPPSASSKVERHIKYQFRSEHMNGTDENLPKCAWNQNLGGFGKEDEEADRGSVTCESPM